MVQTNITSMIKISPRLREMLRESTSMSWRKRRKNTRTIIWAETQLSQGVLVVQLMKLRSTTTTSKTSEGRVIQQLLEDQRPLTQLVEHSLQNCPITQEIITTVVMLLLLAELVVLLMKLRNITMPTNSTQTLVSRGRALRSLFLPLQATMALGPEQGLRILLLVEVLRNITPAAMQLSELVLSALQD
jgi:hypothetical protein